MWWISATISRMRRRYENRIVRADLGGSLSFQRDKNSTLQNKLGVFTGPGIPHAVRY
jgi:hypothetical protein